MTLSEFQKAEGLNLKQLAGRLGFGISTVHGWVSGKRSPGLEALPLIVQRTSGQVTVGDLRPELASRPVEAQVTS